MGDSGEAPRGNGPGDGRNNGQENGQEEEAPNPMVMAAMMEELGTSRVDELPLEDHGINPCAAHSPALALGPRAGESTRLWADYQPDDVDVDTENLDNIANGNLYRHRQALLQQGRGAFSSIRGGHRGGSSRQPNVSQRSEHEPSFRNDYFDNVDRNRQIVASRGAHGPSMPRGPSPTRATFHESETRSQSHHRNAYMDTNVAELRYDDYTPPNLRHGSTDSRVLCGHGSEGPHGSGISRSDCRTASHGGSRGGHHNSSSGVYRGGRQQSASNRGSRSAYPTGASLAGQNDFFPPEPTSITPSYHPTEASTVTPPITSHDAPQFIPTMPPVVSQPSSTPILPLQGGLAASRWAPRVSEHRSMPMRAQRGVETAVATSSTITSGVETVTTGVIPYTSGPGPVTAGIANNTVAISDASSTQTTVNAGRPSNDSHLGIIDVIEVVSSENTSAELSGRIATRNIVREADCVRLTVNDGHGSTGTIRLISVEQTPSSRLLIIQFVNDDGTVRLNEAISEGDNLEAIDNNLVFTRRQDSRTWAIEFGLPYHPVAFVENFTTFLRDNPPVVAPIVTGAQAISSLGANSQLPELHSEDRGSWPAHTPSSLQDLPNLEEISAETLLKHLNADFGGSFLEEAYKLAKTRDADSAEMLSTVKYLVQSHLNRSYEFWDLREPDSDVVARDRAIGVLQLALAAPNSHASGSAQDPISPALSNDHFVDAEERVKDEDNDIYEDARSFRSDRASHGDEILESASTLIGLTPTTVYAHVRRPTYSVEQLQSLRGQASSEVVRFLNHSVVRSDRPVGVRASPVVAADEGYRQSLRDNLGGVYRLQNEAFPHSREQSTVSSESTESGHVIQCSGLSARQHQENDPLWGVIGSAMKGQDSDCSSSTARQGSFHTAEALMSPRPLGGIPASFTEQEVASRRRHSNSDVTRLSEGLERLHVTENVAPARLPVTTQLGSTVATNAATINYAAPNVNELDPAVTTGPRPRANSTFSSPHVSPASSSRGRRLMQNSPVRQQVDLVRQQGGLATSMWAPHSQANFHLIDAYGRRHAFSGPSGPPANLQSGQIHSGSLTNGSSANGASNANVQPGLHPFVVGLSVIPIEPEASGGQLPSVVPSRQQENTPMTGASRQQENIPPTTPAPVSHSSDLVSEGSPARSVLSVVQVSASTMENTLSSPRPLSSLSEQIDHVPVVKIKTKAFDHMNPFPTRPKPAEKGDSA